MSPRYLQSALTISRFIIRMRKRGKCIGVDHRYFRVGNVHRPLKDIDPLLRISDKYLDKPGDSLDDQLLTRGGKFSRQSIHEFDSLTRLMKLTKRD